MTHAAGIPAAIFLKKGLHYNEHMIIYSYEQMLINIEAFEYTQNVLPERVKR